MNRLFLPPLAVLAVFLAGFATTVGKPFKPQPVKGFDHKERYLVGVLPVANISGDPTADAPATALLGAMIGEIQEGGRYRVIERERLESLLAESEFSLSDLADSANVANIGRLLGVEALCFTNLSAVAEKTKRATMLKGRKHWVALGFMKAGGLDTRENLLA